MRQGYSLQQLAWCPLQASALLMLKLCVQVCEAWQEEQAMLYSPPYRSGQHILPAPITMSEHLPCRRLRPRIEHRCMSSGPDAQQRQPQQASARAPSLRAGWCWSLSRACTTTSCCCWTSTPCTPASSRSTTSASPPWTAEGGRACPPCHLHPASWRFCPRCGLPSSCLVKHGSVVSGCSMHTLIPLSS